jgi:hypothetical protein
VSFETMAQSLRRLRSTPTRRLCGRFLAFPILVCTCAVVLSVPADPKTKPSLSTANRMLPTHTGRVADRGYVSALGAANRFLQAWQNQDNETGLLMLTDDAKQHSSEDRLEVFFSSGADAAYEIARGKRMKGGRYAFPVTLFPFQSGTTGAARPQKSQIVVVRTGKGEWAIDRLP